MAVKRILFLIIAAALLSVATWQAARAGLARNKVDRGMRAADVDLIRQGAAISPHDAETQYALGYAMQETRNYEDALQAFQRAVELRPRDYYLWMRYGIMREATGDQAGAERALRESVLMAPHYARPHWQLGNLLLRMGKYDEAFAELRQAANTGAELFPSVIDLAWNVYGKDAQRVVDVLRPDTDAAHMALALFFVRHREPQQATRQFQAIKGGPPPETEVLQ